jgi:hypothetical protein
VRDVAVTSREARLAPLRLKTSEAMRLRRIARDAIYKEDSGIVVVPLKRGVDGRSSWASCRAGRPGGVTGPSHGSPGIVDRRSVLLRRSRRRRAPPSVSPPARPSTPPPSL